MQYSECYLPMRRPTRRLPRRGRQLLLSTLLLLLVLLTACGSDNTTAPSPQQTPTPSLAAKQVLVLPNVGASDVGYLDPAQEPNANTQGQGPDANSALVISMLYTGLVRLDANLQVLPDQATWVISPDGKVYTFHLRPDIAFSDGTSVTAQTYVYTLTRALLPEVKAPMAAFYEANIVGAADVNAGKAKSLRGVKALDTLTLQITLTQPTPYFLTLLTNAIYFPLNQQLIDEYGQSDWANHAAGNGVGTGPFMVEQWDRNLQMTLVPNPYYYGTKPKLTQVNMSFVNDPSAAFKGYTAGQYSLVWNIAPTDLLSAKGLNGFVNIPLSQTDVLFFNTTMPPFDKAAVRQAFAYATDKAALVHNALSDSAIAAPTILPPGTPGYQSSGQSIPYDITQARETLQMAYPDLSQMPAITFSYPNSLVSTTEATALQNMWQSALGIRVTLHAVEANAYNDELLKHEIAFGFTQWSADFSDPYDWFALNLFSTAPNNYGAWSNSIFDQLVKLAEQTSGDMRIQLYQQAEQIVLQDVGWLPLDHQALAAVIPPWVHGVSLNSNGLFFGDWSEVYLLPH